MCPVWRWRRNPIALSYSEISALVVQVYKMADKVKEVAIGEAERIKSQTIQAARSAAYLYPLKVNTRVIAIQRGFPEWALAEKFVCRVSTTSLRTAIYGMLASMSVCSNSQRLMLSQETTRLQARTNNDPWPGHHYGHVRLHILAPNGCHGIHVRSPCGHLCRSPRTLRIQHPLHNPQQDVSDRRRAGGHLRRCPDFQEYHQPCL